jgi:hypothetical protein
VQESLSIQTHIRVIPDILVDRTVVME